MDSSHFRKPQEWIVNSQQDSIRHLAAAGQLRTEFSALANGTKLTPEWQRAKILLLPSYVTKIRWVGERACYQRDGWAMTP